MKAIWKKGQIRNWEIYTWAAGTVLAVSLVSFFVVPRLNPLGWVLLLALGAVSGIYLYLEMRRHG